jgi:uncharacterized membrane protein
VCKNLILSQLIVISTTEPVYLKFSVLKDLAECCLWCVLLQTVNDVLIGVTSAALSRYYFRKTGESVSGALQLIVYLVKYVLI